jgi:hypothetical protein
MDCRSWNRISINPGPCGRAFRLGDQVRPQPGLEQAEAAIPVRRVLPAHDLNALILLLVPLRRALSFLKHEPNIGAPVAADRANETLFQVGQPHVVGP